MAIKIYIDQGHNPTGFANTGASYFGQEEQDITYEVGIKLAELLRQDGRFSVLLSRPTEDTVLGNTNSTSLQERVRQANEWHADYFISIHANANENPRVNGTEVYVYRLNTQSQWFGEQVLKGIVQEVGTKNNGVIARPGLFVLRRTRMPAILVELAYMSNFNDAEKLRNNKDLFALGIYKGILKYFGL